MSTPPPSEIVDSAVGAMAAGWSLPFAWLVALKISSTQAIAVTIFFLKIPILLRLAKSTAAVAALVYLQTRFPHTWRTFGVEWIEHFGKSLAQRKALSIFLVGFSLLLIRGACVFVSGIPLPRYHDEFSYLLASDTFAHGRLTNPPHPMWRHFETFHVIWHPTYMSMYPPGQGLILALGQALGTPWIGQLLAASLMCGAICWMLQGWISPRWALLGGVLAVARLGMLSYWTNGYWCACLPAAAGALVIGSFPRIQRYLRVLDAVILGVGLAILANTRPYEGLLLSVGVAILFVLWLCGKNISGSRVSVKSVPVENRPPVKVVVRRFVVPLVLTLIPLALWTGYYNFRVTGSPFLMAYEINRDTYAMGRYFIWQSSWPAKAYLHPKMKAQYERELNDAEENKTLHGFIRRGGEKLYRFWHEFLVPPLPFVLIALPWILRDRRLRASWLLLGIFAGGLAVETWFLPHYFAPAVALLYLIVMQCMRRLRWFRWRGEPIGLAFVRAVCLIYVGTTLLRVGLAVAHVHPEKEWQHGDMDRESVVQTLDSIPGRHVIFVRYAPEFDPDREWVYNAANMDDSKIVWARDMGPAENRELLNYYRGRSFWSVEGDHSPPQLQPYMEQGSGSP